MSSYRLTEFKHEVREALKRWAKAAPVLVALVFGFICVELWSSSVGRRFDISVLRSFFAIRGPRPPPNDVVIVSIDEQSFTKLGLTPRSALPRNFFADLIEIVTEAQPKLIIIDASLPPEDLDPAANARIAAALAKIPTTIGAGKMNTGLANNPFVTIPSDEPFRNAAKMELSMLFNSVDGITSLLTLDTKPQADLYARVPLAKPLVEYGGYRIEKPEPMALINFYGPAGALSRVSMYELLADSQARARLAGKVVVLGYQTVADTNDSSGRSGQVDKEEFYTSASSKPMFGVETHAVIVANLIDGSWLRRFPLTVEVGILFFSAFALGLAGFFLAPERAAVVVGGSLIAAAIGSYIAFSKFYFWVPGVATLVVIGLLSMLLGVLYHLGHLSRIQRFIARVFRG